MDARTKRRQADRRRRERQSARTARRRRNTVILSIVAAVVVVAVAVVLVAVFSGSGDSTPAAASTSAASSASTSTAAGNAVRNAVPMACTAPTGKPRATFDGVTVANAVNLTRDPGVSSTSATTPAALACDDLVVGKGPAADAASTVSVQYSGVLYDNGTAFDSSWASGHAAGFSLVSSPTGVVAGFSQGIGGIGKVTPMRVGGRRIIIVPAQLGYGATAQQGIPANSSLVFVVDLLSVS